MNKGKKDSNYFYLIVFITLALVGVVVWQLFFADGMFEIIEEPRYEEAPEINLLFFDSHAFQNLSEFRRGDERLLPWRQVRNENPFKSPRIPRDRTLRDWWSTFNIELNFENNRWIGVYPPVIDNNSNPDLTLFNERWYELKINNLNKEDGFFITDTEGNILISFEDDATDEETIRFQASKNMSVYGNQRTQGAIQVLNSEEYDVLSSEELDGDRSDMDLLMSAGGSLSSFYEQIQETEEDLDSSQLDEAQRLYSEFEKEFQDIESAVQGGELTEEDLDREIDAFNRRINNAQGNLFGDSSDSIEDGVDEEDDYEEQEEDEHERELTEGIEEEIENFERELSNFEEDIQNMDEEEQEEAWEIHSQFTTRLQEIEEKFYNQEIDEDLLLQEMEEAYEEGAELISQLSYYQ